MLKANRLVTGFTQWPQRAVLVPTGKRLFTKANNEISVKIQISHLYKRLSLAIHC